MRTFQADDAVELVSFFKAFQLESYFLVLQDRKVYWDKF